ncbi:uncharacterized protein F4822DRAFT_396850 [Hypoxylon trugodes]|uniref:uncharacterized protein n=1 Tax=Hypoxylon trugodes TaxID=326681 RepID=UPI00218FD551|nr:uncharacterized protein F4822DRAFT_396850 [Hypoxylon trugodes]KAI1391479.1 hypothetical protein F4822DRAFT_396850 [Hypoxylon trugodes]
MALPTMDTQAKVASEAGQNFVDHFYESLNRRRPLGLFYASASPRLVSAGVLPDISVNGLPVTDVAAYESLLEAQGNNVTYDIGSFDAHPVNPYFRAGEPDSVPSGAGATGAAATLRNGDRMSFALQVSGTVRYGRGHGDGKVGDAPAATSGVDALVGAGANGNGNGNGKEEDGVDERPFNEAFLLVPHWEAWARNAPRNLRKWVIVSQNFRAL